MNKLTRILLVIIFLLVQLPAKSVVADYPIKKALADYKNLSGLAKYSFSTEYFKVYILSPISGYRIAIKNKNKSIYSKHNLSIKDPKIFDYEKLDEIDFWSPLKSKVTVLLVPQPQTKNIVKVGRWLGYTVASAFTVVTLGIGMATLGLPGKIGGYKVSKDFASAAVESKDDGACKSTSQKVTLMSDVARVHFFPDDQYEDFINKLYMGVFEFDPACFTAVEAHKLRVYDKKSKKVLSLKIRKSLKKALKQDFSY